MKSLYIIRSRHRGVNYSVGDYRRIAQTDKAISTLLASVVVNVTVHEPEEVAEPILHI